MRDPAHHCVQIERLQAELNSMLAHMQPSPEQQRRIRTIAMQMAVHAVSISAFYEVSL